ncbi:MAG: hypothetical protein JWP41_983, partial [Ramlibacter sp.]|nr:hypothetical protein [Ramlibacter sp.]
MLYRPIALPLPRQRMSPTALATSGALHVALVWLLLQYTPAQQAVRYVVYQAVRPFSASAPSANSSSRAITLPARRGEPGDPLSVFTQRPESSIPLQATDTLPDLTQPRKRQPRRPRRETSLPDAIPAPSLRSETQLQRPQAAPVPPTPEVLPPVPTPPVPLPPVAAPVPVPAPAPIPVPAPAPVPEPAPEPAPVPAPAPVP